MSQIEVIHSGSYYAWPESPRIIVISDALAEALDNLMEVCDDVDITGRRMRDIEPALDRVRRLHDFDRVRLGGEPVLTAPGAEPVAGEETR